MRPNILRPSKASGGWCKATLHPFLLGVVLSGCSTISNESPAYSASTGISFQNHEILVGQFQHSTILTGTFLGGPGLDLASISVADDGVPLLQIFAWEQNDWTLAVNENLPGGVRFADVIEIDGCGRLLVAKNGGFSWFDWNTSSLNTLAELDVDFTEEKEQQVPQIDITRDINGDGRDDLVIPDFSGFWISVQIAGGDFAKPIKLGPPEPFLDEKGLEDGALYREEGLTAKTIPQYLSRVHQFDFNRDDRVDLACWNQDHFDVYRQFSDGTFSTESTALSVDADFDADGVYSHMFGYDDKNGFALFMGTRTKTANTALYSMLDLNNDGVVDIVTHTLEGRSLIKLKSSLAFHFGEYVDDRLVFPKEPSSTFGPFGSQPMGYSGQRLQDLNGDGQLEVALVNVDAGIADMFQVMLANSIDMDVHVFRAQNGVYADTPSFSGRIKPDDRIFGKRDPFFPPVLGGDVNGDGFSELIVGHSRNELHVYAGVPEDQFFSKEPVSVDVRLPGDERNVWLEDINIDGKQDVLIKLRSDDGSHRVTVLMSQ